MKATGIVRRIDDLGRVVIPKEIRRTMRIREGDPLEIYTTRDGEVIFKKYSLIGGLERIMAGRGLYCGEGVAVSEEDNGYRAAVAAPILCEGDVLGAVLFLSPDGRTAGETECKLAQTVAAFLGKNMES